MEFCQASRKVWEVSGQQVDKGLQKVVIGWMFEGWSLISSEQASWWVQDHRVGNTLEERGDAMHGEQPPPLDCAQYRDHHHRYHLLYSATTTFRMVSHPVMNPSVRFGGHFQSWSSEHPYLLAPAHSLTSFSMQQLSGQTLPTYL